MYILYGHVCVWQHTPGSSQSICHMSETWKALQIQELTVSQFTMELPMNNIHKIKIKINTKSTIQHGNTTWKYKLRTIRATMYLLKFLNNNHQRNNMSCWLQQDPFRYLTKVFPLFPILGDKTFKLSKDELHWKPTYPRAVAMPFGLEIPTSWSGGLIPVRICATSKTGSLRLLHVQSPSRSNWLRDFEGCQQSHSSSGHFTTAKTWSQWMDFWPRIGGHRRMEWPDMNVLSLLANIQMKLWQITYQVL